MIFCQSSYFEAKWLSCLQKNWNSHLRQICMVKRSLNWAACFAVFGQPKTIVFIQNPLGSPILKCWELVFFLRFISYAVSENMSKRSQLVPTFCAAYAQNREHPQWMTSYSCTKNLWWPFKFIIPVIATYCIIDWPFIAPDATAGEIMYTVLSRGVRSLFGRTRKSSPWGNFSEGRLNQWIKRRLWL